MTTGVAETVTSSGTPQMFARHQATGGFTMGRSVCKLGLAATLVWGALAFGAAPARAQVYVSGYSAPTPVYSYYYPPSYSYDGYVSYYSTPAYSSYYYAPAYPCYYPYRGHVGWRGHCGGVGRGWRGRCYWR
jgi:hypothetical protein